MHLNTVLAWSRLRYLLAGKAVRNWLWIICPYSNPGNKSSGTLAVNKQAHKKIHWVVRFLCLMETAWWDHWYWVTSRDTEEQCQAGDSPIPSNCHQDLHYSSLPVALRHRTEITNHTISGHMIGLKLYDSRHLAYVQMINVPWSYCSKDHFQSFHQKELSP